MFVRFALVFVFVRLVFMFETFVFAMFVFIGVAVRTGVGEIVFRFVFIRLALALLAVLFAVPPQAIPNTPNAKTAESAIAFFITISSSCLLQRSSFNVLVSRLRF